MVYLIAGGGIAGLAAALSVASQGYEVVIAEKRDSFGELGAGIQIAPNGFRALDRLGLAEDLVATSVRVDELRIRDGVSGQDLICLETGQRYRERFDNPYSVVRRTDLYGTLLDACRAEPAIRLRCGAGVVAYENLPEGVRVSLADGSTLVAEVLLGADGIRSAVRAQMLGDGPPRVSGHTIYRAVVPMATVPELWRGNNVNAWCGENWHLVHYPISNGTELNLAITVDNGAQAVRTGDTVDRAEVLDQFTALAPQARAMLELGRDWKVWVTCDRPPVQQWQDGRVLLIGDAAHPMLQYAAQGASMALEDAVVLGESLAKRLSPDETLSRFVRIRQKRCSSIQDIAVQIGKQVYHCGLRSRDERAQWLASFGEEDVFQMLHWLHGATAFTEDPTSAAIPEPVG